MRTFSLLPALLLLTGCAKKPIQCLDLTVGGNSEATTAVFQARGCQGGGVTWAALLNALARRHGKASIVEEPSTEWTGDVQLLDGADGSTLFSIDEEGDAARFCTRSRALLESITREAALLNHDAKELKKAMAEASAEGLECDD